MVVGRWVAAERHNVSNKDEPDDGAVGAVDYYKTRLSQTIKYTGDSTRLIYAVNGAVVAFIYFVVGKLGSFEYTRHIVVAALVVLAIINLLHARLLVVQRAWYRKLDEKYAAASGARRVALDESQCFKRTTAWFGSTHNLYATIHFVVALTLVVAAIFTWVCNPFAGESCV